MREKFKEGETLRAAGRITAHRDMGKSQFLDLADATGRIQIFIHAKEVGEEAVRRFSRTSIWAISSAWRGPVSSPKAGNRRSACDTFEVLAKALRPLPGQMARRAGHRDQYRQRYLDLIANARVRAMFPQTHRHRAGDPALSRGPRLSRSGDADDAGRRGRRGGRAVRDASQGARASIFICASRRSFTSSGCSWVASRKCSS